MKTGPATKTATAQDSTFPFQIYLATRLIELHDGEIHQVPDSEDPLKYQVIRFRQHDIYLTDVERDFKESGRKSRSDREMNMTDLWAAAERYAAVVSDAHAGAKFTPKLDARYSHPDRAIPRWI